MLAEWPFLRQFSVHAFSPLPLLDQNCREIVNMSSSGTDFTRFEKAWALPILSALVQAADLTLATLGSVGAAPMRSACAAKFFATVDLCQCVNE